MSVNPEKISRLIKKIKKIVDESIIHKKTETAMAAISMGSHILYSYNQVLTDEEFENDVIKISDIFISRYINQLQNYKCNKTTVLFYDGFGLDSRGYAKNYLIALAKSNYNIIYVLPRKSEKKLNETAKIIDRFGIKVCYIDTTNSYDKWTKELLDIFFAESPSSMFFYTTPNDVSGAVAFATLREKTTRFLIDLTDHAFWLGRDCNDYFFGAREISASNQHFERRIPKQKMLKIGVNMIVPEYSGSKKFPIDVMKQKYVFSGGQLYKTLGDSNNSFYKIIEHIVKNHDDTHFLFAGSGDKKEMLKLISKYPQKVHLISETPDYFYLIQNSVFYLNTYPMFGGLMMRYAALAGKIPVTLKHSNDSDGQLIDQRSRNIEYDNLEDLLFDIDRLLDDPSYLQQRESLLLGSVITETRFIDNLRSAIENHHTNEKHIFEHIDNSKMKEEFALRFDLNDEIISLVNARNRSMIRYFPWLSVYYVKKAFLKIKNKLKTRRD